VAAKVPTFHFTPATNLSIALAIAFTKMGCIMAIFMHLKYSSPLVKVFGTAALLWMLIFFVLIFGDFASHGWHNVFVSSPYSG
jgi:caa(3)-type oxidase subunit IV